MVEGAEGIITDAKASRDLGPLIRFRTYTEVMERSRLYDVLETREAHVSLRWDPNYGASSYYSIVIGQAQAKAVAFEAFTKLQVEPGETIVIQTTDFVLKITQEIVALCEANNVQYVFDFVDYLDDALKAKYLSDTPQEGDEMSPLQIFAEIKLKVYKTIGKMISVILAPDPRIEDMKVAEKSERLAQYMAEIEQRKLDGTLQVVTIRVPNLAEADRADVGFDQYIAQNITVT
jgi:hypothetical protein